MFLLAKFKEGIFPGISAVMVLSKNFNEKICKKNKFMKV